MDVKTIQLATDGATNHLVMPDGLRLNLGMVSPLKLVQTACRDKRQVRRILDEFNNKGQVMLKADMDMVGALLTRRPARFASPLMKGAGRTHTRGTVMADNPETAFKDAVEKQIDAIERMIGVIQSKAADGGTLTKDMISDDIANLKALVKGLREQPSGQSDNRAFYAAAGDQNAAVVNVALDKLAATTDVIGRLATAGRKFNAVRAREDVLAVGGGLRHVLASMDLTHPEAGTEIRRLAERADRLYGLFANAK
jgi:hypothetical protein